MDGNTQSLDIETAAYSRLSDNGEGYQEVSGHQSFA